MRGMASCVMMHDSSVPPVDEPLARNQASLVRSWFQIHKCGHCRKIQLCLSAGNVHNLPPQLICRAMYPHRRKHCASIKRAACNFHCLRPPRRSTRRRLSGLIRITGTLTKNECTTCRTHLFWKSSTLNCLNFGPNAKERKRYWATSSTKKCFVTNHWFFKILLQHRNRKFETRTRY